MNNPNEDINVMRMHLITAIDSQSELGFAIMLHAAKEYILKAPEAEIRLLMARSVVTANQIMKANGHG